MEITVDQFGQCDEEQANSGAEERTCKQNSFERVKGGILTAIH